MMSFLVTLNSFMLAMNLVLTIILLVVGSRDRTMKIELLTGVKDTLLTCLRFIESAKEYMRSAHINQQLAAKTTEVVAQKITEDQKQPSRSDVVRRLEKIPQQTADLVTENIKSSDSGIHSSGKDTLPPER